MNDKKTNVEVERVVNGARVVLKREVAEGEQAADVATELCNEINKLSGSPSVVETASISPQTLLSGSINPTPELNIAVPEMPTLSNAPHSYTAAQAVLEIMNPERSKWAREARSVKEVQARLMDIGVRGVNNLQNFDSVVRVLLKQGRIRREKIDGIYKYFFVPEVTA